jgi:hypothetical protein
VKSDVLVVVVKFSSSSSSSSPFGEFGCEKSCAVLKKKLWLVGWFVCLLGSYLNPNRFVKACSSSSF